MTEPKRVTDHMLATALRAFNGWPADFPLGPEGIWQTDTRAVALRRAMEAAVAHPWVSCYDCGLPYSDEGWCDCVVPHDVWACISPTGDEGGILCLHCMARRIVRLNLRGVPLMVTSGPFQHVQSFDIGAPSRTREGRADE